jgi:CRP-like cAMP-binding protein
MTNVGTRTSTVQAVAAALSRTEPFGRLDQTELDRLAQQCRVRRVDKAEQVFARGDLGDGMFVVAQGSIALSMSSADGGEVVLAVLRPPQTFGELAVIDTGPRVATATARQASVVLFVPGREVLRLLREHPPLAETLLASLARTVRRMDDHASDLVLLDLPRRVAKFLLAAAGARAAATPGDTVPVDLRLTQTELARQVGGSRQQVNRVIVTLEADGAIARSGSRVVAVRPDVLRARIGPG